MSAPMHSDGGGGLGVRQCEQRPNSIMRAIASVLLLVRSFAPPSGPACPRATSRPVPPLSEVPSLSGPCEGESHWVARSKWAAHQPQRHWQPPPAAVHGPTALCWPPVHASPVSHLPHGGHDPLTGLTVPGSVAAACTTVAPALRSH